MIDSLPVGSAPTNPLGPPHPCTLTNVDVALRVVPVVLLPLRTTLLIQISSECY